MPVMNNNITFILKPTHLCNAECVYCSAYKDDVIREKMSMDVVKRLFERILEYKQTNPVLKNVKFIWHGGEPLLMGADFYYDIVALQEKYFSDADIVCENQMQSNLLLLTKPLAEMMTVLLKRADGALGTVGTSYDPVDGIRVVKGFDYSERWHEKIELLKQYKIPYGIVYVVHRRSLEKIDEIFHFFKTLSQRDSCSVRFNPMYAEGKARKREADDLHLTSNEWGGALTKMYQLWIDNGQPAFDPFREYSEFHHGGDFALCCDSAGTCSSNHLGVDFDGSIYQCGRGLDDKSMKFGNVMTHSLGDIFTSTKQKEIRNRKIFLRNTLCSDCVWWEYCHGGCPSDALVTHRELGHKTMWCAGRRLFFENSFGEPKRVPDHLQDVRQYIEKCEG